MRLSAIAFESLAREGGTTIVVPWIDGVSLIDFVAAFEREQGFDKLSSEERGGLIPEYFRFGPLDRHYLGRGDWPTGDDGTVLLGCQCGEWACDPFYARIEVEGDVVRWSAFGRYAGDEGYAGLAPIAFARDAYEEALRSLPVVEP
ncbi:hypothetical protein G5B46_12485 [Caulobacter sp. 602-2]|uniref:Uncharacterized protein n=1 Tax=Caulobacter sp. 602-2 TaxID=2710887 RepID=A0A6G4QZR5_9CAUL|nr:hypothetical protein [Caulobacter sp. 602-2]NGM50428.1 hypothetical protein [Caulobacter sp. 602-2]